MATYVDLYIDFKMALRRAVKDCLKEGGATSNEIDYFLDFSSMFAKREKIV